MKKLKNFRKIIINYRKLLEEKSNEGLNNFL